jgi:5-methyltetrahydropteroyltriglutamate--homocysteine methyltransferase
MPHKLLPTTLVGSYPQPGWLVDKEMLVASQPARVRMEKVWRFSGDLLIEAQQDAARLVVADQERAGVDILTDGEVGRESYFNLFATGLKGIDLDRPGTAINRRGGTSQVPRVAGPIAWERSALAPAAVFLRSITTRPIKVTVPGPFTLTSLCQDDHYGNVEALAVAYADAVNAELKALKAVGVDVVQLDEPYLQARPEEARRFAIPVINRALAGVEGTTALHLCFGYAYVVKEKPSGYSFLAELEGCTVDQVSIEAAQPKLDLAILAALPSKTVILGVLDLERGTAETADEVAGRIRAALKHVAAERLVIAPDCGMKYLPRALAYAKMKAMCDGAAIVRGEIR